MNIKIKLMKVKEYLENLRNQGFSDNDISNKTSISSVQIYKLRIGKSLKPNPSTAKIMAESFGYDLKYIDDKPNFFRKPELVTKGDEPGISELGVEYRSKADKLLAEYGINAEDLEFILKRIWSIDFTFIDFISKKIISKS